MKIKVKTLKAFSKRIKSTANGFTRKKANKGHLLRKKNSQRKRRLSQVLSINLTQSKLARRLIQNKN
jgi:large subunit ribosomal protein L35